MCHLYTLFIKQCREQIGMTQEELAFKIGKTQGFISQIEKDNSVREKSPQLITLIEIADALNVCPNDLIRFRCMDCKRFNICNKHQEMEDNRQYFEEHFDFYI